MDETINLTGGTASLDRNVRYGEQEADHMIVQNLMTGHQDDVVVLKQAGELKVRRVVTHIDFKNGSTSVSFAELPQEDEKRLLATYHLFSQKVGLAK